MGWMEVDCNICDGRGKTDKVRPEPVHVPVIAAETEKVEQLEKVSTPRKKGISHADIYAKVAV
jgi:hypothetical protein